MVKAQTVDTAAFFGFDDRGRVARGLRTDLNVIEHAGLRLHARVYCATCPRAVSVWCRV